MGILPVFYQLREIRLQTLGAAEIQQPILPDCRNCWSPIDLELQHGICPIHPEREGRVIVLCPTGITDECYFSHAFSPFYHALISILSKCDVNPIHSIRLLARSMSNDERSGMMTVIGRVAFHSSTTSAFTSWSRSRFIIAIFAPANRAMAPKKSG